MSAGSWGGRGGRGSLARRQGEGVGEGKRGEKGIHSWVFAFCISLLTTSPRSRLSASESWLMSMSRFDAGEVRSIGRFGTGGEGGRGFFGKGW